MEFSISKGKRRANSLHLMGGTTGGKVVLAAVAALLLLAVLSPLYASGILDWLYGDTAGSQPAEDMAYMEQAVAISVPAFWLIMAFMVAACAFRQRNVGVAMRVDEHIALDGSILTYSFHSSGDRHSAVSRNVIMADLSATRVSFDASQRHWVLEGGVYGHYYRCPADELLLSMREMEPIPRFTIGAHFDDPFDDVMKAYAVH